MTTQTMIGQEKRGLGGVLAMTAATVALLGGVMLWQVQQGGDDAPASATTTARSAQHDATAPLGGLAEQYREAQRASVTRDPATAMARGGMAEVYAEQAAAAQTAANTVYLVESEAEAERLREADQAVSAAMGMRESARRVEWFDSAEAETRFLIGVNELNTLRGALGATPVSVIDLRTAGSR